jgi:hypothetical protein
MAERTFRSPGFFDNEVDLSQRQQSPVGTPAGIVGTAEKGPAFVPVTVGSFADFKTKFGNMDPNKFGPYAVDEFLRNRNAVTYIRVLGCGAISGSSDIETERTEGTRVGAGFRMIPAQTITGRSGTTNTAQFIVANHYISASEIIGMPMFTDNDSFDETAVPAGLNGAQILRAMILPAAGARVMVMDYNQSYTVANTADDLANMGPSVTAGQLANCFKLVISSSAGSSFANDDGAAGIKIYTASLDPDNTNYISKVLNTNPEDFSAYKHVLYASFDVDAQLASVRTDASSNAVAILSGSDNTNTSTYKYRKAYGLFNAAFKTPTTPNIISQPYGLKEYDLFRVESLSDGAYSNSDLKVSVKNVRASTDPNSEFGTFTLQVRKFSDTDLNPEVLEEYPFLSLDRSAPNYVASVIGDKRAFFNFNAEQDEEKRLVVTGKYPNKSALVRIVESSDLANDRIPKDALPFGARGPALLKSTISNNDSVAPTNKKLLSGMVGVGAGHNLTGSILPPVPYRFKVTRGNLDDSTPTYIGEPGSQTITDGRFYWGVKFERNTSALNANPTEAPNKCISAFTKFLGLAQQQTLVSGSGLDTFNNNKFTLARVALNATVWSTVNGTTTSDLMKEATYIRNGVVNPSAVGTDLALYTVNDSVASADRLTMASAAASGSLTFNRFANFNKFSVFMYGGFDGLNILDKNAARMNDKSTSTAAGGGAGTAFTSPGLSYSTAGIGRKNSAVIAYRTAADILTDPFASNINILAIPGIRDALVTNHAADDVKEYSMAFYVMDIPSYDDSGNRLFNDSTTRPSVRVTREQFETRAIDNNYVGVYFPDVIIEDPVGRHINSPSSIAALGALGYNDKVGYPWFAPAGFNRGALDFVRNVDVRLTKGDRDDLYDARINPIATFPRQGFVIFGQKTLQFAKSALDRVNVRRLMLELKRLIVNVAEGILFEPNTPATRAKFIAQSVPLLALIQAQAGVESFKVIMDGTNNSAADIEQNRLNGKIIVVPTRAVEFIVIDFIITNSGVSFE